jgi:hypothetical protein
VSGITKSLLLHGRRVDAFDERAQAVGEKRLDLADARDREDFNLGQRWLHDDLAVFDDFGRIDVFVDHVIR